jgi:hypothetical protein
MELATMEEARLTTKQKITIFRSCFTGRDDIYGTYDPATSRAWQVKGPVTDKVLLRHLQGIQPYGVYLLCGDRTGAVVADFDEEDTWAPLQFLRQARHYGINAHVERSKTKGWHIWGFFPEHGVLAAKARSVFKVILDDIQMPAIEVFPKQDRLCQDAPDGNFINAPMFGVLVPKGRTVFVDPDDGLRPFVNQWSALQSVQRVPESLLDQIIEVNSLGSSAAVLPARQPGPATGPATSFGLPPCAQRMLVDGVTENQRVACFRLAVDLKKAGLPQDVAIACLNTWAIKNRPSEAKRIITDPEIRHQTASAYSKGYRACGCEDPAIQPFCVADCPLMNSHAGRQAATPSASPAVRQSERTNDVRACHNANSPAQGTPQLAPGSTPPKVPPQG